VLLSINWLIKGLAIRFTHTLVLSVCNVHQWTQPKPCAQCSTWLSPLVDIADT